MYFKKKKIVFGTNETKNKIIFFVINKEKYTFLYFGKIYFFSMGINVDKKLCGP